MHSLSLPALPGEAAKVRHLRAWPGQESHRPWHGVGCRLCRLCHWTDSFPPTISTPSETAMVRHLRAPYMACRGQLPGGKSSTVVMTHHLICEQASTLHTSLSPNPVLQGIHVPLLCVTCEHRTLLHRRQPTERHIVRFCNAYLKFCNLQLSALQKIP
jgi:hypothetical protein